MVFWSPVMSVRNRLKFETSDVTCLEAPNLYVCKHKWDLRSAVQWRLTSEGTATASMWVLILWFWPPDIWIWISRGLVLVYDFLSAFLNLKRAAWTFFENKVTRVKPTWSLGKMAVSGSHRAVCGVGAAEVRTRPGAEVGVVPFGLVDPPPAQILPEVDVQRPNAAVLLVVSESRRKAVTFSTCPFTSWRGFCIRSETFPYTLFTWMFRTSISALHGLINMSDSLLRLRNSTVRCVIFSLLDPTQVWSANRDTH